MNIPKIQVKNIQKFKQMIEYHEAKYRHMFYLTDNVYDLYNKHIPCQLFITQFLSNSKQFAFKIIIQSNEMKFAPTIKWQIADQGIIFNTNNDTFSGSEIAEKFYEVTRGKLQKPTNNTIEDKIDKIFYILDRLISGKYSPWNAIETMPSKRGFPILLIIENSELVQTPYVHSLFSKWSRSSYARPSMIVVMDKKQDQYLSDFCMKVKMELPSEKEISEWIGWLLERKILGRENHLILDDVKKLIIEEAYSEKFNLVAIEDIFCHPTIINTNLEAIDKDGSIYSIIIEIIQEIARNTLK